MKTRQEFMQSHYAHVMECYAKDKKVLSHAVLRLKDGEVYGLFLGLLKDSEQIGASVRGFVKKLKPKLDAVLLVTPAWAVKSKKGEAIDLEVKPSQNPDRIDSIVFNFETAEEILIRVVEVKEGAVVAEGKWNGVSGASYGTLLNFGLFDNSRGMYG